MVEGVIRKWNNYRVGRNLIHYNYAAPEARNQVHETHAERIKITIRNERTRKLRRQA